MWVIVLALVLMHLYERGERRYLERTWEQFDLRIGREFFPLQARYHAAVHRLAGRLEGVEVRMTNLEVVKSEPPEYAGRTGWSRRN